METGIINLGSILFHRVKGCGLNDFGFRAMCGCRRLDCFLEVYARGVKSE